MQHFTQVIDGIDGSRAELVGYVIDNSPEMDPDRRRPAILIIPGGGYAIGSDRESEPVALQFLAAGYQAFVLSCRVVSFEVVWIADNMTSLVLFPSPSSERRARPGPARMSRSP